MSAEVIIEFERECYSCHGRSGWMPSEPCTTCNSSGKVPTRLGQELLEFLEHQGLIPASNQHHERKGVR